MSSRLGKSSDYLFLVEEGGQQQCATHYHALRSFRRKYRAANPRPTALRRRGCYEAFESTPFSTENKNPKTKRSSDFRGGGGWIRNRSVLQSKPLEIFLGDSKNRHFAFDETVKLAEFLLTTTILPKQKKTS